MTQAPFDAPGIDPGSHQYYVADTFMLRHLLRDIEVILEAAKEGQKPKHKEVLKLISNTGGYDTLHSEWRLELLSNASALATWQIARKDQESMTCLRSHLRHMRIDLTAILKHRKAVQSKQDTSTPKP